MANTSTTTRKSTATAATMIDDRIMKCVGDIAQIVVGLRDVVEILDETINDRVQNPTPDENTEEIVVDLETAAEELRASFNETVARWTKVIRRK